MKILRALLVLGTVLLFGQQLFGQGPLNPTAAPMPTMKSLDQIEARTPISSAPYTISSRGSYYLTGNMSVASGNAITIAASGVTLDLNGFTIYSNDANANGTGILINSGLSDITIVNGHIQGTIVYNSGSYSGGGFVNGVGYTGTAPANVRVAGVSVAQCLMDGINLGRSAIVVRDCNINTVGGSGILADVVSDSTVYQGGIAGIDAITVNNCHATATGASASGIYAGTINNSLGYSTGIGGYGVYATSTANNCYGQSVSGTGVHAITATGCQGYNSGSGYAVYAGTAQNCYGQSSGSGFGVFVDKTALNCYGAGDTGIGLVASIAVGCSATVFSAGTHQYFCGSGANPYP